MCRIGPLPASLALLVAGFAFASLACSGGKGGSATTTASTSSFPVTQGPITLQIVSPAQGANVSNTFTLTVQATGIQIADWSERVPGAAHFHAFLDTHPVPEGTVIPSGTGIFHFFTDSVELPRVATGQHKITVVLADNSHVRLQGAPTAVLSLTVGPTPAPTSIGHTPSRPTP